MAKLKPIWRDKNINLQSKVKLLHTLILSIFLYACESWTLTAELQREIQALEMRCFRRLLGISYRPTDRITNEEVRRTISRHVKDYEDILTTVKKWKLKWYGHVTRSTTLSKTILQGRVQGKKLVEADRWKSGKTTSQIGQEIPLQRPNPMHTTAKDGAPKIHAMPLRPWWLTLEALACLAFFTVFIKRFGVSFLEYLYK